MLLVVAVQRIGDAIARIRLANTRLHLLVLTAASMARLAPTAIFIPMAIVGIAGSRQLIALKITIIIAALRTLPSFILIKVVYLEVVTGTVIAPVAVLAIFLIGTITALAPTAVVGILFEVIAIEAVIVGPATAGITTSYLTTIGTRRRRAARGTRRAGRTTIRAARGRGTAVRRRTRA